MPQTEAQKRAKAKYDSKTYKSIACKCKIADFDKFQNYANSQGISSMNALLYKCVMYCVDNGITLDSTTEWGAKAMRSESQKRADKNYIDSGKCKYKTASARLHIDQYQKIESAAGKVGMTVSKFLLLSALYCIKHNINIDSWQTVQAMLYLT